MREITCEDGFRFFCNQVIFAIIVHTQTFPDVTNPVSSIDSAPLLQGVEFFFVPRPLGRRTPYKNAGMGWMRSRKGKLGCFVWTPFQLGRDIS